MNQDEARQLLGEALLEYRALSYAKLASNTSDDVDVRQVRGASGVEYTIEIDVLWDGKPNQDVRVVASIDDGGLLAAAVPLSDDFIMAPSGAFLGE